MHTGFWWGNLKKRGHFEDLGVIGRIILKQLSERDSFGRFIRFRIWTCGVLL
jgi:hypothetical protein